MKSCEMTPKRNPEPKDKPARKREALFINSSARGRFGGDKLIG
jgi:hypothetical protein